MKIKFLMAGILGLVSATSFAQKGELSNAQSNFETYQVTRGNPTLSLPKLTSAKTSIDKAALNEKTSGLAQTYALKGAIYGAMIETDSVNSAANFAIAEPALKKAMELDTKGEYKKIIDDGRNALAIYQAKMGIVAFRAQKYDAAYKAFDYYRSVLPEDTNAILNTGLSAYNSKNYPAAITNFEKLVSTKYNGSENVYDELLSEAYLANKDTVGALKSINAGIVQFPKSTKLRNKEVFLSLTTGKQKEALEKIKTAIAADPTNPTIYYYAGAAYARINQTAEKQYAAAKLPADKARLLQEKTQSYDTAVEMYKKAIELNPSYIEAVSNLGYLMSGPALDSYNEANKQPGTAAGQKQFTALMAKAGAQMDLAKPYLIKANELQPNNADILGSLLNYYKVKKDDVNASKISKQIKDLK